MTEQKIKQGDWFCAIEGLAIADKIFYFYFEEFDKIPQNKNVGDYKMSVIQYRLFCDFDGNPIKRNRFKIFNYTHAYKLIFEYIETFYNTVRIHSHCGYLSPNEYEEQYLKNLETDVTNLAS